MKALVIMFVIMFAACAVATQPADEPPVDAGACQPREAHAKVACDVTCKGQSACLEACECLYEGDE